MAHPIICEWLFARECLRRLGFAAEDLFFVVYLSGQLVEQGKVHDLGNPIIACVLRTQGKEFTWTIGAIDLPVEQITQEHAVACESWNDGRHSALNDDAFFGSQAFANRFGLIHALVAKGIVFDGAFDESRN